MRIAQVAPLYERVPPEGYGGTERVVAYLTDALIEQGHQVTLFASGDSITPARLAATSIEALACGTPVIAWPHGSVPEVLEDGVTGFHVRSVEQAIAAVRRLHTISRARCRAEFERRFTADRMAKSYVEAYERLIARSGFSSLEAVNDGRRVGPESALPRRGYRAS